MSQPPGGSRARSRAQRINRTLNAFEGSAPGGAAPTPSARAQAPTAVKRAEPSAAPQNDQEAMKFLKKSGSSSYDPSVQVNMSHKYES